MSRVVPWRVPPNYSLKRFRVPSMAGVPELIVTGTSELEAGTLENTAPRNAHTWQPCGPPASASEDLLRSESAGEAARNEAGGAKARVKKDRKENNDLQAEGTSLLQHQVSI